MIDITGIPKPVLLAALVNSHPMSRNPFALSEGGITPAALITAMNPLVSVEECAKFLEEGCEQWPGSPGNPRYSVDYVFGRPIKTDFTGDEVNERLYDRDAGAGAFARVVASLRGSYPAEAPAP